MTSSSSEGRTLSIRYELTRAAFSLDVDIELAMQGVTGVFGPSGAGKTTLLRCMAGLEKSDAGRLVVDGTAWEDSSAGINRASHRRQIGYVFQGARLFPHMNVSRNLEYGLHRAKAGNSAFDFDHVVNLLALENLLDRRPATLSGGEVQRVAIGRALLCAPRMILMDEPLAALDEARKEEVLPFIERLHAELKMPIVYVSHNIDEICRLCDQLVVMDAGRVMTQGGLQSVLLQTEQPILSGKEAGTVLFGRIQEYDLEFDLTRVETAGSQLWVPGHFGSAPSELRLRVRANDVSICLKRPEKTSILNVMQATIEAVQDESSASMLAHLRAGDDQILARITRRSWSELGLQPGDTVFAQIKSIAVRNRPAS